MEKHECNVRLVNGLIVCAKEVMTECINCKHKETCQELDIHLQDKYEGNIDHLMREAKGVNL